MKLFYSAEVAQARRRGVPIVALETSVVAQGLPYPQNIAAAERCETAVREAGAIPASMAVIEGKLYVGLEPAQLKHLAVAKQVLKLGSRDLAWAVATGASGGTTVSATCEMAAAAGIHVFATGGLGGVHRGVEDHMDISQDLPAIAKWPVAVVCAGAKSVLDLPRTMEMLETLGVPILGVGTHELPGFYSRETGIELDHSVKDAAQAAQVIRARRELAQGGVVFALPPPKASALPRSVVETHLKAALALAKKKKIQGKAVTPFLLSEMAARTKGKSLKANLDLLENNADFAARVAVSLGWK